MQDFLSGCEQASFKINCSLLGTESGIEKDFLNPIVQHESHCCKCWKLLKIGLKIGWGFCDFRNNQGRDKGLSKPKAEADNPYRDLDYSG